MATGSLKRTAIITGANGGLGKTVTQAFLDAGLQVAAVARTIAANDLPHGDYIGLSADLLDSGSMAAAVGAVLKSFGRIDVLVHLVGGFEGGKPVAETDDAALDRMLNLNLRSAFNIFRSVVPHMRRDRFGRIIAIGSRTAVEPQPLTGAYGASKAALVSLVRTLALENADQGITANVVLPSTIDTPSNRAAMPDADFTKWVRPEQVAHLVLWLASDGASQTTGALIPIYGG